MDLREHVGAGNRHLIIMSILVSLKPWDGRAAAYARERRLRVEGQGPAPREAAAQGGTCVLEREVLKGGRS